MNEQTTQEKILKAFQDSETHTVDDVCEMVGINQTTFYYHLRRHPQFRIKVLLMKAELLADEAGQIREKLVTA